METAHLAHGQSGYVRLLCHTDFSLSSLRVPLQIDNNSDVVIDSVSFGHTILQPRFIVYSPIADTLRRDFVNVLSPMDGERLPTFGPPGGEICRIYFRVLPTAAMSFVAIDTFYTEFHEGNQTFYDRLDASDPGGNSAFPDFISGGIWIDNSTAVGDEEVSIPDAFELGQNFPNPFNSSTLISFSLPKSCQITLDVFNLLGNNVARLANGRFSTGSHSVVWNAAESPSGVYFYRLTSSSRVLTGKMTLLK